MASCAIKGTASFEKHCCSIINWNSRLKRCPTDSRKTWYSFSKKAGDAIRSFMPYRQVHVDSLLRSMTDTVDIGYLARSTSPYWPLISGKTFHIQNEYPILFLSQQSLVENPQCARTEWSQLGTSQLVEYWKTEYLAKRVSRTELAGASSFNAPNHGESLWILVMPQETRSQTDHWSGTTCYTS